MALIVSSLRFIPSDEYASRPETDPISGWTYVRVARIQPAGVARTLSVGTLNIDVASDTRVLGFEIEMDTARKNVAVDLPHDWETSPLVAMQVDDDIPNSTVTQAYDANKGILSLYLGDERGATKTWRLSPQVIAICSTERIVALHVLGVAAPTSK